MFFRKKSKQEEETSYWLSFSDLMASVLIIFILLFVYNLIAYEESMNETEKMIQELTSTRMKIITMLQEEFDKEDIDIIIDPKTGAIQLNESILFDSGKSQLKDEGKLFAEKFIPIYVKILLGNDEIKSQISQIIIEGHTDDIGGYLYNLKLSQERSLSVAQFLINPEFDYMYKNEMQKYLTINGRSYSEPILNSDGSINKDASRRVEIKFRLKEEEVLLQIQKELEKGSKDDK
ncbi:OmpA/MotB family protein [Romboutsia ilealis]|uniref:OmpA/MotB family protein n=1 Tax=Romboutsia ilealis TaxID=1115758 RepID=UPI0025743EE7|nr:OmpA family protein [Romboutsia ilealis]